MSIAIVSVIILRILLRITPDALDLRWVSRPPSRAVPRQLQTSTMMHSSSSLCPRARRTSLSQYPASTLRCTSSYFSPSAWLVTCSAYRIQGRAVGQVLANTGAFLKDIDLFDHLEFGVTSKDVTVMPAALRKLIEVTFLSLRDSSIDYRGQNVGCFMSGVAHDIFSISGNVRRIYFVSVSLRGL